ncbi:MAG: carboxylesterase family protein [Streptosporangiaceae bacterium]|jgi:para-nitrobenzyl esterase
MDVTEPVVRTAAGQVRGRTENGVAVFRGIPFAQPPVGDLRFAAPQPARAWDGVREAAMFGPPPPQSGFLLTPMAPAAPDADPGDWLTVNVFSPDLGAAGLPVMVWIYGGAYRFGASSMTGYDGGPLASRGVVLVTFNHRIGVEGYAYLPGVPANRGLLDQVAALRWVRENIAAFGGDPERVTVFGESAGAGAIASLLVMPAAAGLFRRAIAQSVPGTFFSPDLAADVTVAIAAAAGLPPTAEAFAAADPARLAAASDAVRPADHRDRWGPVGRTGVPFSPVVDGEVLPVAPWQALASGAGHDVDLITGHNRDEYRLFTALTEVRGKVTDAMAAGALRGLAGPDGEAAYREAYPDADAEALFELVYSDWLFRMPTLHLAQAHAAGGSRTFLYQVSYPATEADLGACHAIDVPLVFGVWPGLGRMLFGAEPPASAVALSDLMGREWTAFAASGDPGWPPYSAGRRLTRVFDDPPDVVPYPEQASMHIWDQHRFGILDLIAARA